MLIRTKGLLVFGLAMLCYVEDEGASRPPCKTDLSRKMNVQEYYIYRSANSTAVVNFAKEVVL